MSHGKFGWNGHELQGNHQIKRSRQNLFDAMGANNIASFAPTAYVTGKVDRAFSFNGTSGRIIVNNSTSLNFSSNADFSIEMWIKTGATNTLFPNVPLLEKRNTSTT